MNCSVRLQITHRPWLEHSLFLVSNWSSPFHLQVCASDLIYPSLVHRVSFAFHNLPLSLRLSFLSILLLYCWFIRRALSSSAKQTPSYLNHFFINCHALTFSRFDIINFFIIRLRLNEDLISAECQQSANTITCLLFLSKYKFYQC